MPSSVRVLRFHHLLVLAAAALIGFSIVVVGAGRAHPAEASAAPGRYYVSTAGSDANDGLSPSMAFATIQHAVDLCPEGGRCGITLAPGVYSQKTSVIYYKVVTISGPTAASGACVDRSAVVVDDKVNGTPTAGTLFFVQDHAILTISCLTLAAYAQGSIGFASRQFAIGDVNYVNFVQFPQGVAVAANETSKINVYSPGVYGNASRWASASDLSQLNIGGTIDSNGASFEVAFVSSLFGSVVNVVPTAVTGSVNGYSYQCVDSIIKGAAQLPGNGKAYPGSDDCHLR